MPSPSSRMCHYCVRCCWDGGQVWLGIATPAVDCRGRTAVKSDSFQSTDKSCLTHWLPPWGLARVWALLQSCCSSCLYFQWKPNQQGFRKEISYRWSDVKMLGTYVWIHGARSLNIGPEWCITRIEDLHWEIGWSRPWLGKWLPNRHGEKYRFTAGGKMNANFAFDKKFR